uniref:Uncharacterized protein n=3 Tax=Aegilops tauschii subsp. strangulata TaxID=200361 RepID=A0A453KGV1_AEGTS
SSKSAGQRPDQPRPHLVEMGRAGRGRSRRWAPCASCLLGRRYDPIRRGGNLRVRQRGRGPVAREGWRPVSAPHKLGRSSDEAMLVLQMSSKRGQSSEDSMESDVNACRLQLLITQSQCIGANAAFGVGEAQATCCKRQMVTYSRRRGSQVFFRQFQFSRAVAIIVRLPTGGTTMALCSSHIRSLGGWSFPVT